MYTLYLVSAGYVITYNATEYEFDISVYSSVGTVVFEALLITAENVSNQLIIRTIFPGDTDNFGFNFDHSARLIAITLKKALDPNDSIMEYRFAINYSTLIDDKEYTDLVNVILHEIGKSHAYTCNNYIVTYSSMYTCSTLVHACKP